MRSFVVIANPDKEGTLKAAEGIREYLEKKSAFCSIFSGTDDIPEGGCSDAECIITLGGDGTILKAAPYAAARDLPLIGVNMGHLGYLTAINTGDDIEPMLNLLLEDRYSVEPRIMLRGNWVDARGITHEGEAFNEIVVGTKRSYTVIRVKLTVNGEFLNEYACDGIIIATPTGSTAYNLSAGGPILESTANMILATPICAHAFTASSIVLSADNHFDLEVAGGNAEGQIVMFDGRETGDIDIGSTVHISKSDKVVKLITLEGFTFTGNLRKKLEQL